jgi:hypothetical protein
MLRRGQVAFQAPCTKMDVSRVSKRGGLTHDHNIHNAQEVNPRTPIKEPALSQVLRRFTGLRAVNPDEWPLPLRCEDATLPALLVRPSRRKVLGVSAIRRFARQPWCSVSSSTPPCSGGARAAAPIVAQ